MVKRIYADGACRGNPGPGGWGVVVLDGITRIEMARGYEGQSTNNAMELIAVIKSLKFRSPKKPVISYLISFTLIISDKCVDSFF